MKPKILPIIPEEKQPNSMYINENAYTVAGWNCFRNELLTNLKERGVEVVDKILEKEGHLVDWGYRNVENPHTINHSHYIRERTDLASAIVKALTGE